MGVLWVKVLERVTKREDAGPEGGKQMGQDSCGERGEEGATEGGETNK